ncbi:MAG: T9SS type A sorting domain-containing protein, partial [Bacteroidales bacterium]|nr:T9SS type A sorting domain-containing protein [Bacteroidales bacterium]
FTTAPQDNFEGKISNEALFQGHRKNEHIRDFVKADENRILFDYADILCYDDDGTRGSVTWNNNTFPGITAKNAYPINMGHISDAGNLRLAKAMWWMLARIAGWDDVKTNIDDSEIVPDLFRAMIESKILSIQMLDTAYSGTVSLYSLQGSMLDSKQINGDTCVFDTSQIPPGVYIIVARTNSGSQSKKIVLL